jgi:hypothetical protein
LLLLYIFNITKELVLGRREWKLTIQLPKP